jgi:uncharacterized protein DUF3160/FecR-like protein
METDYSNQQDELVERAFDALREMSVSDAPPPDVEAAALAAVERAARMSVPVAALARVRNMRRMTKVASGLAAAACIALAVLLAPALWPAKHSLGVDDLVGCTIKAGDGAEFEVLGPRRVRLADGEITFDVEPNEEQFVVETPAGSATVLGTRFRVKTQQMKGTGTMRSARYVTMVAVLSGLVQLSNPQGVATAAPGEVVVAEEGSAPTKAVEKLANRFGDHYKPIEVNVKPAVPPYTLPVRVRRVDSLKDVLAKFKLTDQAFLRKHGFAIYPQFGRENDDFVKFYKNLKDIEVPVYITADSVLHLYHLQFDKILQTAEEREFIPALAALLESLDSHLGGRPEGPREAPLELVQARRLARAYLHLTRRLLTDRTAERPLLQALRVAVTKAGRRSYGLAGKHAEAMKCFRDPGPARQALSGVPRRGKEAALRIIDAELAAIDASAPKSGALPAEDEAAIENELALIAAHKGFEFSPLFVYKEDYSQYVPRGHYTRSPALKRYFKAMMYLGRLTFLVKGGTPHGQGSPYLVSAAEARRQTLAAAMLTEAVAKAELDDGVKAVDIWTRIYDVTAFMVGTADDLGYEEYARVLRNPKVFALNAFPKGMLGASSLLSEENFFQFKKQIGMLQPPAIYSGTGDIVTFDPIAMAGIASDDELDKQLAKTMGFRLMGQRFVPDSYWMGKLVFPTVGAPTVERDPKPMSWGMTAAGPRRVFPRGLDVAALLGSHRAAEIMAETGDAAYDGYDKTIAELRREMADLSTAQWNVNLYWSWLYCLKPLLVEFGPGYPTYMRGAAWQDKELATALGSWSQLRHDTILYAKQSYTMIGMGMPPIPAERPGYVEPVPEVYARLLALCRLTKDRMAAMKCLDEDMTARLDATETLLARLLEISKRELENKVLDAADYKWIRNFASAMRSAALGRRSYAEAKDELKTTLVADVHTDGNTRTVLEEATGQLALLVVVNKLPNGKLYAACGPVFTHYEFKQPMADRLTDEAWREMLREGKGRGDLLPDWYRDRFGALWDK